MQLTMISNPAAMEQAIAEVARACDEDIAKSDRPTDSFPLKAIIPLFVVDENRLDGWKDRVAPELWKPLATLTDRCFVCPTEETGMQSKYYALDHKDLMDFRQGLPVLKIIHAIKHDQILNDRTKHMSELKIREALEFAVFSGDIAIGELQTGKLRLFNKNPAAAAREDGLEFLRQYAWTDGVPTKGEAKDKTLSKGDQQLVLLRNLRREGEILAVKCVPTAVSPADVVQRISDHVQCWAAAGRTAAEYDEALVNAAAPVKILMKACAHVTAWNNEKRALGKAAKKARERAAKRLQKANQRELDLQAGIPRRRRWRPLDLIADPMTKRRHGHFSKCEFSTFELMLIAFTADVDPNLISTAHALATREFILARMLRQLYWRQRPRPEFSELPLLHELLFDADDRPQFCQDTRAFLTKAALDLASRERWAAWFDNPSEPLLLPVKK